MAKGTRATQRIPVLILVAVAHVGVLLALIALNRVPVFRGRNQDEPSLLVWLPEIVAPAPASPSPPPARPKNRAAPTAKAPPLLQTPEPENAITPEPEPQPAPDWEGSAHAAASAEVDKENGVRRQASRFAAPHSAIFAAREVEPHLRWDPDNKNRLELIAGGAALHLNDHCAVAIVLLFPFFGCTFDKIPARGDLLEHMKDAPGDAALGDH